MITDLLKYLYFFLLAVFVYLFFLGLVFANVYLDNNFIYLFSLLVIPVVDIVVEQAKKNLKILLFIAVILFCYTYLFNLTGNQQFIDISLTFSYIFLVTGAITQYAGFIVDVKNKKLSAKKTSNVKGLDDYFYILYLSIGVLFLIGLFLEAFRFVFSDYSFIKLAGVFLAFTLLFLVTQKVNVNTKLALKKTVGKVNSQNLTKLRKYLNDNKLFKVLTGLNIRNDIVFYILFLFLSIVFTISYIYKLSDLIILTYVFVFISYIAFKLYGFKLDGDIHKKAINSNGFLFGLIVFTIAFVASVYKLVEGYYLNDLKDVSISSFALLFMVGFVYVFADRKIKNDLENQEVHIKIHKVVKKKSYLNIILPLLTGVIGFFYFINNYPTNIEKIENKNDIELYSSEMIDPEMRNDIIDDVDSILDGEQNLQNNESEVIATQTGATNKVKIGELYQFENYLSLYNESDDTLKLQEFMTMLGYYSGEVNGKFDGNTREALRNILMYECHWPTSTKGVLGDNAADCIEGLEVER
ncbi:MAG: peptidoglycan-binding domain-containing protein [Candidatus Gracilibacteria bacterium]|nr:peptidoglycan-binding domain-containing protein [Candidatus Gracilibacteria bacterium]